MKIKEVSEKYGISQDTLRYYEKAGVIPKVTRNEKGIRDYQEQDLVWIEQAICMRNAGLSIDVLIQYLKLYQMGDETIGQRCELLKQQLIELENQKQQIEETIQRLNYKISRYEEALITGTLDWKGSKDGKN